ncbi:hypothetical protein KRM28CT15_45160 [Krasilnikovia sp. M28-CT-15]
MAAARAQFCRSRRSYNARRIQHELDYLRLSGYVTAWHTFQADHSEPTPFACSAGGGLPPLHRVGEPHCAFICWRRLINWSTRKSGQVH